MHVSKSLVATLIAVVALTSQAVAVEYGNLSNLPGDYTLWPGESTTYFYVANAPTSTTGSYAIQIGDAYDDDYTGGVLIPSVAQNLRDSEVHAVNVAIDTANSNRLLIKTRVSQDNVASDVDVSAAYFRFSENWAMGYTYMANGDLTGAAMDSLHANGGLVMGTNVYDNNMGATQLLLPGVNSITDGVLLAVNNGGAANDTVPQSFAMVQANDDGSFHILNHQINVQGATYYQNPVGFVFIPHGTPGAITGIGTTAAGIVAGSGFTLENTADNTVLLTIDGYSPNEGTLVINPMGGRNSTDDNLVTYEIVGNSFEIHTRDIAGPDENDPPTYPQPALETSTNGRRGFSFAFLPFDTQATAPGTIQPRVDHTAQVSAANIQVTEFDGTKNYNRGMVSQIAQATPSVTMVNMNKGDNSIGIGGNFSRFEDGVMMATVRQDYRDNSTTNGASGIGLANPFSADDATPDGWGWEVATNVADSVADAEMNVHFATSYFPFKQGWAAGTAEAAENATGQDVLTVNTPGVDSRTAGLLFVNSYGNNSSSYATAAPTATGDGWNVGVYGKMGTLVTTTSASYNYVYLPYGQTENVTMGSVSAAGALGTSQGSGITVTPVSGQTGVYRLSFAGKTPDDGMLLLTATSGGTANGNAFLIYDKDGSDFIVHAYQCSADPFNSGAQPTTTDFNFALVDFDTPPTLGSGAVNPFGTAPVAAASWQITAQNGDNTAPIINRVGTSDSSFDLYGSEEGTSRGDLRVKYNNSRLMAAKGLFFTQVCENQRDNTSVEMDAGSPPTMGIASWGLANPWMDGNAYLIATMDSDPVNANDEFDVNVAAAFFPYSSGFQCGYVAVPGGQHILQLPGAGDTRRDGVLVTTAMGNDDNFSSAGPTSDGSGWLLRNVDNKGTRERDDIGYVYLPYGTENLAAGLISADGHIQSGTDNFHIERVWDTSTSAWKTGVYRLTIQGAASSDGILLLNATDQENSSENLLTYAPDGDGFLINGLDADDAQATMSNTQFTFAFVKYAAPPENPQLRAPLDPTECSAANLRVIQRSTAGSGVTSYVAYDPTTIALQATERFHNMAGNKGDFDWTLDGVKTLPSAGIMMVTVRNNGRDNGDGTGTNWGVATNGSTSTAWASANSMGTTGPELNCDLAVAFFKYDGHWAGGCVTATSSGATLKYDGLGDYTVSRAAAGQYVVSIDGVNANTNGLLFAIATNNGNDVASVGARTDGAWNLYMYEGNDGNALDANFSFLYLPFGAFKGYEIDGLLAGQIAADGSTVSGMTEGAFSLTHTAGTGEYLLSITGETPETGMLMLTTVGLEDNTFSYEASGNNFLIKSNDLGNGAAGLLEDCGFNFAFIAFDDPMQLIESTVMIPGDANHDSHVDQIDAKALADNWGTASAATWEMGDFNDDGKVDAADASIMAANWGYGASESQNVPEPTAVATLLTLAAVALAVRRRS